MASPSIVKGKLQVKLNEVNAVSESFNVTLDKPEGNHHLAKLKEAIEALTSKHLKGK